MVAALARGTNPIPRGCGCVVEHRRAWNLAGAPPANPKGSAFDKYTPASLRALDMFNQRRWAVALLGATIVTFLMAASADAATLKPNRVRRRVRPAKITGS